jgi:hypothetical protein
MRGIEKQYLPENLNRVWCPYIYWDVYWSCVVPIYNSLIVIVQPSHQLVSAKHSLIPTSSKFK